MGVAEYTPLSKVRVRPGDTHQVRGLNRIQVAFLESPKVDS